jgi:hypothetical protein
MATQQFIPQVSNHFSKRIRVNTGDSIFYVYPDKLMESIPLPETEEDAIGDGFLVISEYDSKFCTYYLCIANEEYIGSLDKLESILYDWSLSEGYQW